MKLLRFITVYLLVFAFFTQPVVTQRQATLLIGINAVTCDSDATAFNTTAGITDATQKTAICTLVADLKTASLWTKFNAIYPFVGGSASTHSYNLKNTAQFQITWTGTITHNANGVTGNGTTGTGLTGITPSTTLTLNNTHTSVYSRTNADSNTYDLGAFNGSNQTISMVLRNGGQFYGFHYNEGASFTQAANANSQGFYISSRRASNDFESYKNGASVNTSTTATGGTLPNTSVIRVLSTNNVLVPSNFSSRNIALISIGSSVTDAEASAFYTIVQAYQTTLGRQV